MIIRLSKQAAKHCQRTLKYNMKVDIAHCCSVRFLLTKTFDILSEMVMEYQI